MIQICVIRRGSSEDLSQPYRTFLDPIRRAVQCLIHDIFQKCDRPFTRPEDVIESHQFELRQNPLRGQIRS